MGVRGLTFPTAPAAVSVPTMLLAGRRGAINCTGPVPYHPVYLGITLPGSRRSACRPAVVEEQDRAGTPGCSAAARWALSTAPVARAFMVIGDRACDAFSTPGHFAQKK